MACAGDLQSPRGHPALAHVPDTQPAILSHCQLPILEL
jgi:hypothetical protein